MDSTYRKAPKKFPEHFAPCPDDAFMSTADIIAKHRDFQIQMTFSLFRLMAFVPTMLHESIILSWRLLSSENHGNFISLTVFY